MTGTQFIGMMLAVVTMFGSIAGSGLTATPVAVEAERIELPNGAGEALYWQGSPQAVLLAHGAIYDAESWSDQARVIQSEGYSVLAVEEISADSILTAIMWLIDARGAAGVVVIGASAGGSGALDALSERPEGVVGLVLLGATGSVEELSDYPKLFTASEGEGMRDRLEQMAEAAPGDENRVEIVPGEAHAQETFREPAGETLLDLIIDFLEEDADWPAQVSTPVA